MKKSIIFVVLVAIASLSFTIIKNESSDEKKFLGSWSGSEKDNQRKDLTKYWIQNRYKDGTFVLIFTTIENCEVDHLVEKGKWWLKDGLFYELHNDGKTDIYSYEILDENQIKFKAKEMSIGQENNNYEFIDTKVEYEN
jgi:hypothetical protein